VSTINTVRSIILHAITFGRECDEALFRELAEENGRTLVQH